MKRVASPSKKGKKMKENQCVVYGLCTKYKAHKLVFSLNQVLNSYFTSNTEGITLGERKGNFQVFEWQNNNEQWRLIENKRSKEVSVGIFSSVEKNDFLLQELRKVDFFLEVPKTEMDIKKKLENLYLIQHLLPIQVSELKTGKSIFKK